MSLIKKLLHTIIFIIHTKGNKKKTSTADSLSRTHKGHSNLFEML